jgi:hypothetical protein
MASEKSFQYPCSLVSIFSNPGMEKTPKNEKILSDRGTEDLYPPPPPPQFLLASIIYMFSESNMYTECITRIKIVRVVFKDVIFNFYLYFSEKS